MFGSMSSLTGVARGEQEHRMLVDVNLAVPRAAGFDRYSSWPLGQCQVAKLALLATLFAATRETCLRP